MKDLWDLTIYDEQPIDTPETFVTINTGRQGGACLPGLDWLTLFQIARQRGQLSLPPASPD